MSTLNSLRFLSEVEYLILQVSGCHWSKLADLSTRPEDSRDVVHSFASAAKILPVSPDKSWLIFYKTDSWISIPILSKAHCHTHTPCATGQQTVGEKTLILGQPFLPSPEAISHLGCPLSCNSGRKGGARAPSLEVPLWLLEPFHLCIAGNEIV